MSCIEEAKIVQATDKGGLEEKGIVGKKEKQIEKEGKGKGKGIKRTEG